MIYLLVYTHERFLNSGFKHDPLHAYRVGVVSMLYSLFIPSMYGRNRTRDQHTNRTSQLSISGSDGAIYLYYNIIIHLFIIVLTCQNQARYCFNTNSPHRITIRGKMSLDNLSKLPLYLDSFEQTDRTIFIDEQWLSYCPRDHGDCLNTNTSLLTILELNNQGCLHRRQGKFQTSDALFYSAFTMCNSLVSQYCHWRVLLLAIIHCNLGRALFIDGDYDRARRHLSKAEIVLSNILFAENHCCSNLKGLRQYTTAYFLRSAIRHSLAHICLDLAEFEIGEQMISLALEDAYRFASALVTPEEKADGLHDFIYSKFALATMRSVEESLSLHVIGYTEDGV